MSPYDINNETINWVRSLYNPSHCVAVPMVTYLMNPQYSKLSLKSLFLSDINDLPESIKSEAPLFADDTIVYF